MSIPSFTEGHPVASYVFFLVLLSLLSHINPLNAQLNPICHLLALLGAHHILHISRIRVKRLIRGKLKIMFYNVLPYVGLLDLVIRHICHKIV
jgi:phosphatidylserine synthase